MVPIYYFTLQKIKRGANITVGSSCFELINYKLLVIKSFFGAKIILFLNYLQ